jgi:DNA-binding beta-propeller fold protein YncE
MGEYYPDSDGQLATKVSLHNPFGVTVSPITGMIYVSDSIEGIVRKVDPSTGIITTPIRIGQEGIAVPSGMWFTRAGHLYIADHGGRTIVKVVDFE